MDYSNDSNLKREKYSRSSLRKISHKVILIVVRLILASFLIFCFAAVGTVLGAYMGVVEATPQFDQLQLLPDSYTTIVYLEEDGSIIDKFTGDENREYVKFKDIPQNLKDAFVAIEDERFYTHNGIDIRGIFRAAYTTITTSSTQGGSTLTQQLIKNNVTNVSRNSIETKVQEIHLALEYEKNLVEQMESKEAAKDYILELYMNTIALHHNLNGVKTAAMYYFGKEVSDLSLAECASIAAITQNPSRYAPDVRPDDNLYRRTLVLDKMLELNFITKTEYDEALAEDISIAINATSQQMASEPSYHSYYMDQVIRDVTKDLQEQYGLPNASEYVYNSGLQIYVPFNPYHQEIVDTAFMDDSLFPTRGYEIDVAYGIYIKNGITGDTRYEEFTTTVANQQAVEDYMAMIDSQQLGLNDVKTSHILHTTPQPQAAMVIMDYHTGYVTAIAGSRGEKQTDMAFNRATQAYRSPGSVFKVVAAYLPAIDMGLLTPNSTIEDAPYTVNGKSISNWNGRYLGYTTVRRGIEQSMNVLATKALVEISGIQNAFDYLLNLGFTTLVESGPNGTSDLVPSLALGGLTNGVYQHEVAAAYGTIANGGLYNTPKFYTKVLDREGNVLLENKVEPVRVIKEETAYMLTDMMEGVLTSGTGTKARFQNINMPAAGKTGTTTNTKDLTFVGYTPYYVASIWTGYDQQKIIQEDNGYHMILWRNIMEEIHQDLEYKDFDKPDEVVYTSYCTDSGLLARTACYNDPRGSRVQSELFNSSNPAPTGYCNLHVSISVDSSTGMKAGANCPDDYIVTRYGILGTSGESHVISTGLYNGVVCTVHDDAYLGLIIPSDDIISTDESNLGNDNLDNNNTSVNGNDNDNPNTNTNFDNTLPENFDDDVTPPLFITPDTVTPSPAPTPVPTPEATPVPTYNPGEDFNDNYIEDFYNNYDWEVPETDNSSNSGDTNSYIDDFYNNYDWEAPPENSVPSIDDFGY